MPDSDLTLGFDTSAAHCAAALLSGERVLAEATLPMSKGQAERLFPLLEEILSQGRVDWRDLSRIGVGIGPGNFTGTRISVAAARGLALSLNIPAIGVSAPDAMAFSLPRPLRVIIPAARGEVIVQDYPNGSDPPAKPVRMTQTPPQDGTPITGPGADRGIPAAAPLAVAIARIARERDRAGTGGPPPAPIYLRPADAAPSRETPPRIIP